MANIKHISPDLSTRIQNAKLGTFHIGDALQDYEVGRSNFFTLVVQDLGALLHPSLSYTSEKATDVNNYITKDLASQSTGEANATSGVSYTGQDVIQLSINKAFVPHFDLGTIEVKRGNSIVKFADTPTWQSGTLEFEDFVGLRVKECLQAWQNLAYDPNSDTQGRASDWYDGDDTTVLRKGYKKNCTLVEYTPDWEVVRSWTLVGCWIKSLQESPFDVANSNGGRQITVQFEYDRAYLDTPDKINK